MAFGSSTILGTLIIFSLFFSLIRSADLNFVLNEVEGCSVTVIVTNLVLGETKRLNLPKTPYKLVNLKEKTDTHANGDMKRHLRQCETVYICMDPHQSIMVLEAKGMQSYLHKNHNFKRNRYVLLRSDFSELSWHDVLSISWSQRLKYLFRVQESAVQPKIPPCCCASGVTCTSKWLRGQHIKVTSFPLDPYVVLQGGVPVGGYFYNLLVNSANYYNFTYDLELPTFKGTVQLPNGSFVGPIGEVSSGEKDIVLGSAQTLERMEHMDFPTHAGSVALEFVTAHPQKHIHWDAIIFIFSPSLWLMILICCCANLFLFYNFMRLRKNLWDDARSRKLYSQPFWPALTAVICPLLEQGSNASHPPTSARRFVLFLWLFSCTTLVAFYKTDFIASVTIPKKSVFPETFEELGDYPDYKIQFMFLNAAGTAFFNTTRSPAYAKLRERFLWEKNKLKCVEAAAFEPKTVCIGFDIVIGPVMAKNLTARRDFDPHRHSKFPVLSLVTNMGFTKGSKFVDSFSQIVGFLRDTGIIWKWKEEAYDIRRSESIKWVRSQKGSDYDRLVKLLEDQQAPGVGPLEIANLFGGFSILFIGLVGACLHFSVERVFSLYKLAYPFCSSSKPE